ncbi:MAG: DUF1569 domain-containing protein [Ginsengibacter sp.]
MKTIFNHDIRNEFVDRINELNKDRKAQWGKMNVCQMIKHCAQWEEMALGKTKYKQSLLGKVFGKMALKNMIKDDNPVKKNMPTVPSFKIITLDGNVEVEKQKWIELIKEYGQFSNDDFIHPFFGKMHQEQIGILAYKHIDHHLRQFEK